MAVNDSRSGSGSRKTYGDFSYDQLLGADDVANPDVFCATTDIYENQDFIFMDVEIPGVNPSDISVTLKNHTLVIQGRKSEESTTENQSVSFYCAERTFGNFKREFRLGHIIQSSNIKASYKNGMLLLTIPKVKERRQEIHKVKVTTDE